MTGTPEDDLIIVAIYVFEDPATVKVTMNGADSSFAAASIRRLVVRAGDGHDDVQLANLNGISSTLYGEGGNDGLSGWVSTLIGGPGDDAMAGQGSVIDYSDLDLPIRFVPFPSDNEPPTVYIGADERDLASSGTTIRGTRFGDTFDFTIGADGSWSIEGGAGDDRIIPGVGLFDFDLGAGNDTVELLYYPTADFRDFEILSTMDIEVVRYGSLRDMVIRDLSGEPQFFIGSNVFFENPAPPKTIIYAGGGDDTVLGGVGAEMIYGEDGYDHIEGGAGNDTIRGGAQKDYILGQAGRDRIYGDGGNDNLFGGSGNDTIFGGPGKDRMYGQAGNDLFYANDRIRDSMWGDGGTDKAIADRSPGVRDFFSSVEIVRTSP